LLSVLSAVSRNHGSSWNVLPVDTGHYFIAYVYVKGNEKFISAEIIPTDISIGRRESRSSVTCRIQTQKPVGPRKHCRCYIVSTFVPTLASPVSFVMQMKTWHKKKNTHVKDPVKEEGKKVGNTERRSLLIVDSRSRESIEHLNNLVCEIYIVIRTVPSFSAKTDLHNI
jgi:hypothetical protein